MACCHLSSLVWLGLALVDCQWLWVLFECSALCDKSFSQSWSPRLMLFFCCCTKYLWISKYYVCYWVGWITYVHWSCVHLHIWYRKLLFCFWCCVLKFVTWFCLQTCVADTRWLKRFLHCLTKKNSPKSRYKRIDRDMSANSSWLFEARLWRLVNINIHILLSKLHLTYARV